MPKAKCSCGAVLKIPEGLDKFKCPQCDKVLRIPGGRKPPETGGHRGLELELQGNADDEENTIEAPAPIARSQRQEPAPTPAARAALERARMGAQVEAKPTRRSPSSSTADETEAAAPPFDERTIWHRTRMWSRWQLALLGIVLLLPLIPIQGERQGLDRFLQRAQSPAVLQFDELAKLIVPLGGLIALLGAVLPLGHYRGALVASVGTIGIAFAFAHIVLLPTEWLQRLEIFKHTQPRFIMAGGLVSLMLGMLCTAVAQNRSYASAHAGLKALAMTSGVSFLLVVGAVVYGEKTLLLDFANYPQKVLATPDLVATYSANGIPSSDSQLNNSLRDRLQPTVLYINSTAIGGLLLAGLLSLAGFIERRWLARVTAFCGGLALLVIPLWVLAINAMGWGSDPQAIIAGLQSTIDYLSWVFAPILLTWLGLRDYLAADLPVLDSSF